MSRRYIILFIAMSFIFVLHVNAVAQSLKANESSMGVSSEMHEVQGEVSAISRDYIAVVYERSADGSSEKEIGFPFDKNVRVEHKQSAAEISVGDTVYVQYEEARKPGKQGGGATRKAKLIGFIRAAPIQPVVTEPEPAASTTDDNAN